MTDTFTDTARHILHHLNLPGRLSPLCLWIILFPAVFLVSACGDKEKRFPLRRARCGL